ncbi:hypothetical protein T01_3086 [Trichinella spiralis]|uniref:Uncharacterized protein n=1 Tax=Trichinella spiralis TaxID=6334 RepID=A0A0V1BW46_TRISP|nr:hypothetical protein T01_8766 [Trichinella spiralis]KRY42491.1 hypothetical protein T01_3086 [Trichinella spiralis]
MIPINLQYRNSSSAELTDFPMYHLVEVEVAALYPRIRKVSPNCRYQGCFKITDNGIWINPWVVSGLTGVRDPTYLAWYLVQEDEHQSAAAVFLSNFCSPGGFADKWPALAFSCCIVTLSQLIRTVDTTFSFVVKYNNFWLLSLSSGNDASVVMHAAQQYNVLILFWHVFYQGVAHEPVVHGDVSSSSDYCRAKPFDDCCGRGVHLMRPFILLAYQVCLAVFAQNVLHGRQSANNVAESAVVGETSLRKKFQHQYHQYYINHTD